MSGGLSKAEATCALAAPYTGINTIAIQVVVIIVNIVVAFFGTLANGLVIIVYYRNRRLRTHQATIFLLLAITDLGITACAQPLHVVFAWKRSFENLNCVLTTVIVMLSILFLELSLITIVILSLHTYITLAFPYRSQNLISTSRLITVIFFSWLLILLKNLGFFSDYEIVQKASFGIMCSSTIVVTFIWCWTYKLVAKHQKVIQTNQTPSRSKNASREKILRSTITAFVIVTSLIACYSLCMCFTIFESLLSYSKLGHDTYKILWSVAATLMYSNSLLNRCLVFWRNSGFKKALESIFI